MAKKKNWMREALEDEAKRLGVEYEIDTNRKHHRFIVYYRGESRFITYSSTGKNNRAAKNNICAMRHELRSLGMDI